MTQEEKSSALDLIYRLKSFCDEISDSISIQIAERIPTIDDKTLRLFNVTREGMKEEAIRFDEHVKKVSRALIETKDMIDKMECSE